MNQKSTTLALVGASALTGYILARYLAFLRRKTDPTVQVALSSGRDSSVIPLVDDFLTVDASVEVVYALQELRSRPVVLLLHTLGGPWFPAMQIARAVRRHGRVTALVPFYALSGGTFIALACRKIAMWPDASLGPIDPQLGWISASSHVRLQQLKSAEHMDDRSILLGLEAQKAIEETASAARELGVSDRAMARLMSTVTTHSHPISPREAIELGLPVEIAEPTLTARREVAALVSREMDR